MTVLAELRPDATSDYETLLEFLYLAPVGIIKFRPDGAIQMLNPEAARLLLPLSYEGDLSNLYRLLRDAVPDLSGTVSRFHGDPASRCDQLRVKLPQTGVTIALSVHKIDAATLMAVVQDITHAVAQELLLHKQQHRLDTIYDCVHDHAVCTVGGDGRIEAWNRSLKRVGGWMQADVEGQPHSVFFPPTANGQAAGSALLERARAAGFAEFEGWHVRNDGSQIWASTVASALPGPEGRGDGYVLITRDMTARKRREDQLAALAATDPLTGAENRRAGETRLKEAFSLWRRRQRASAILMVDADHFKTINDRWGHDAGDTVLIAMVCTCRQELRESDQVIRWGGEEFLILLRESDRPAALVVAERLRGAVEAMVVARNQDTIPVTVSIGVATITHGDRSANDVVQRADQALYVAKQNGRNRVSEAAAG